MSTLNKTFNFGKINFGNINSTNKPTNLVEVEVELRETPQGKVFSAMGTIWESNKSDAVECGQNLHSIAKYIADPVFLQIYELWKKYHLNNLNPGTPEQEDVLKRVGLTGGNRFKEAVEYLKSINLYEVQHEGEVYKYGEKWLFRPIPQKDLELIENLLK